VSDQLPHGWEMVQDKDYGTIFINHIERKIQAEDPRLSKNDSKQRMIDAFMSASRGTSSEHLALQPPCLTSPSDPATSDVDSELQRSMQNVMKLRRGLNLPVSGEQNNKEQLEQIIRRMDKEIQTLSNEVARSEREQVQHRSLLDVADKEKELEHASRQFANPSADPAAADEASRKCERLQNELQQAKLFNNSKVAQNMFDEKRIESLIEQIKQKEECKRRLLSVLDEPSLRNRRAPARSQTFSEARQHPPERFADQPAKGVSLINLNSEERLELNPPINRLSTQIPRANPRHHHN